MKMTTIISALAFAASVFCGACSVDRPVTNPRQDNPSAIEKEVGFARGADVSWLTQMESEGRKFYTPEKTDKKWSVCSFYVIIVE